jgi:hypothetical protein
MEVIIPIRNSEDNLVNDAPDLDGDLPLMDGSLWRVRIRIEDGAVLNWPIGMTAKLHAKVVDSGVYSLLDKDDEVLSTIDRDYVPQCLQINDYGYGDYVYLTVGTDGVIDRWPSVEEILEDFEECSD